MRGQHSSNIQPKSSVIQLWHVHSFSNCVPSPALVSVRSFVNARSRSQTPSPSSPARQYAQLLISLQTQSLRLNAQQIPIRPLPIPLRRRRVVPMHCGVAYRKLQRLPYHPYEKLFMCQTPKPRTLLVSHKRLAPRQHKIRHAMRSRDQQVVRSHVAVLSHQ